MTKLISALSITLFLTTLAMACLVVAADATSWDITEALKGYGIAICARSVTPLIELYNLMGFFSHSHSFRYIIHRCIHIHPILIRHPQRMEG